jgi:hypothetical protein
MDTRKPTRVSLNLIGAIILFVGASSAIMIYLTAGVNSGSVLGYEDAGGSVYPVMPEDSKEYLRGLQLYGGTANELADDFRRWFSGLWHGKSLAFIVFCITVISSSCFFYAAKRNPPYVKPDMHRDKKDSGG